MIADLAILGWEVAAKLKIGCGLAQKGFEGNRLIDCPRMHYL
jgi:hypothetical protein